MKKNILLFIFALVANNLVAQITVTNASFPTVGDTLRTAVDAEPSINLQSPGEDITWNFTFLDGPAFESIILDPNDGSSSDEFQNATTMTGQLDVAETYYSSTATQYRNLGLSGGDPLGLGLAVISKNNPPLVEQTAPLNYGDVNNSISSAFVPFAWDDLPTQITDNIGGAFPISPDSIAFEMETDRTEEVDAWGTVFIPGGNFEVLRVRRWDVTDRKVKAYLPFFNWTDVTDIIAGNAPTGGQAFGKDTTLTFLYYSNDAKEPIAVIRADPMTEAPTNAQYKSIDITTGIIKLHEKKPNIYAYPNPAIEDIRFDLVNIPNGRYDLKIYNILGVEVWSQQYQFQNSNDTIMLNVSDFKKGAYLYSLINEKGKKIATRRLVILRP